MLKLLTKERTDLFNLLFAESPLKPKDMIQDVRYEGVIDYSCGCNFRFEITRDSGSLSVRLVFEGATITTTSDNIAVEQGEVCGLLGN